MSYALQIGAVLFGLAMIGFFDFSNQKSTKLLLAFSGSYLFSVVVIHFLPELYHDKGELIGIAILAGFLLQILLDFYSTGLEHGHFHAHDFKKGILPVGAVLGLFAHAFFEGLPIDLQHTHEGQKTMLLAIVLHKVPITIVLYTLLRSLELSSKKMWTILLIFSIMSPFGTFIGSAFPILGEYSSYLTAFASGIFLHVSTTILFESSHNHRYNFTKLMVVVLAMVFAYLSILSF